MVTTRYSDQQGSKSRQKVMRLYKQWHRPISKQFIKTPYPISRATSIDSECCHLPTTSVLSKKNGKNTPQPVLINKSVLNIKNIRRVLRVRRARLCQIHTYTTGTQSRVHSSLSRGSCLANTFNFRCGWEQMIALLSAQPFHISEFAVLELL